MIRQLCPASLIRSSCTLGPIDGMGREAGIPSASPSWISRSRVPASERPSDVKGGLLIEPCKKINGLPGGPSALSTDYARSDISGQDRSDAMARVPGLEFGRTRATR